MSNPFTLIPLPVIPSHRPELVEGRFGEESAFLSPLNTTVKRHRDTKAQQLPHPLRRVPLDCARDRRDDLKILSAPIARGAFSSMGKFNVACGTEAQPTAVSRICASTLATS